MSEVTAKRKRMPAGERRRLLVEAAGRVFAARGYQGAAMEVIAREAGVTVPVVYDHFRSKAELYLELVHVHYAGLRAVWFEHASTGRPLGAWLHPAVADWFGYVEAHPFAATMLFHEATGDPATAEAHRAIQDASRGEVTSLLRHQAAMAGVDLGDDIAVALAWETLRSVLQGLAMWWHEHPHVPRDRIVDAAMSAIWLGLDRVISGERWANSTSAAPPPAVTS